MCAGDPGRGGRGAPGHTGGPGHGCVPGIIFWLFWSDPDVYSKKKLGP